MTRCVAAARRGLVVVLGDQAGHRAGQLLGERGPVGGRGEADLAVERERGERLAGLGRAGDQRARRRGPAGPPAPAASARRAGRASGPGRAATAASAAGEMTYGRRGGPHHPLGDVALAPLLDQLDQAVPLQRRAGGSSPSAGAARPAPRAWWPSRARPARPAAGPASDRARPRPPPDPRSPPRPTCRPACHRQLFLSRREVVGGCLRHGMDAAAILEHTFEQGVADVRRRRPTRSSTALGALFRHLYEEREVEEAATWTRRRRRSSSGCAATPTWSSPSGEPRRRPGPTPGRRLGPGNAPGPSRGPSWRRRTRSQGAGRRGGSRPGSGTAGRGRGRALAAVATTRRPLALGHPLLHRQRPGALRRGGRPGRAGRADAPARCERLLGARSSRRPTGLTPGRPGRPSARTPAARPPARPGAAPAAPAGGAGTPRGGLGGALGRPGRQRPAARRWGRGGGRRRRRPDGRGQRRPGPAPGQAAAPLTRSAAVEAVDALGVLGVDDAAAELEGGVAPRSRRSTRPGGPRTA